MAADWRQQGQGQRRRAGAPSSHLDAANTFLTGDEVQQAAHELAAQMGHHLSDWDPYGAASMKARCLDCGAEARAPYSLSKQAFLRPEGPGVNPRSGSCSQQASRYAPTRRNRPHS